LIEPEKLGIFSVCKIEKERILEDISMKAWVQISFRKWLKARTTGLESGFEVSMTA